MLEEQDITFEQKNGSENNEISSLQKELAEIRAKAEANLAGWQRAQADYANYKRRAEQEREDIVKYASAALILRLLPVIDDFERATASFPDDIGNHPWVEGMRLIQRKMKSVLENQGVTPIATSGEKFDPRFHEAVRQVNGPEGLIIEEVQKGYKFFDRVIRTSQVAVGNGQPVAGNDKDIQKEAGAF